MLEFGESDLSHAWQSHVQHSRAHSGNFLRIFWQQMLEAVHTVHQQRIVHSDLKLANFVLVKVRGRRKIRRSEKIEKDRDA